MTMEASKLHCAQRWERERAWHAGEKDFEEQSLGFGMLQSHPSQANCRFSQVIKGFSQSGLDAETVLCHKPVGAGGLPRPVTMVHALCACTVLIQGSKQFMRIASQARQ